MLLPMLLIPSNNGMAKFSTVRNPVPVANLGVHGALAGKQVTLLHREEFTGEQLPEESHQYR